MTVSISINGESQVFENIVEFEEKDGAYSLVPKGGEGFSIPVEGTQGFKVMDGSNHTSLKD